MRKYPSNARGKGGGAPNKKIMCPRFGGRNRQNPVAFANAPVAAQLTAHWAVEQNCAAPPYPPPARNARGEARKRAGAKWGILSHFVLGMTEH